jgi:hypothetical protein
MAYFTQSTYHKYIDLQNVSGSGDPADAPAGGVYLFASGAVGSAKLYLQNEGVSTPLSIADAGTLQIAGDSGTDDLSLSGDTFTYTGGTGIATAVTDNTLTINFDIDELGALGGTGVAQGDHFVFSDGGTEKKITFSNMEDAIFSSMNGASSDVAVAAGGAISLADDSVGADELAANAVVNASIASNAAIDMDKLDGGSLASSLSDLAQGDLMYAGDVDDSNNIKSITFSNLEDAIFGNVSGDATIAAGGALTLAANSVSQVQLDDDAVGADELAANAVVEASIVDNAVTLAKMAGITRGSIILGDSSGDPSLLAKGTAAQFLQSDGTDPSYVSISGDATVAAGGALTIGTGVVEHAMLAGDAVDGDNIADDSVNSEHIALGALDAEHYASGSIQGGHVAQGALGAENYATGSIQSNHLAGSVANAKLANSAVTLTQGAGMAALGSVSLGGSVTVAVDGVLEDLDTLGAASADGEFIVATGAGAFAYESGDTARLSLGVGTTDSPTFAGATVSALTAGRLVIAGASKELADNGNLKFDGTNLVLAGNMSGSGNMGIGGGLIVGGAGTSAFSGSVYVASGVTADSIALGGGYSDGGNGLSISSAGALSMNGALAVGSPGEGVDSTFHGGTSGEAFVFDASENHIKIQNSSAATLVTMGGNATTDYGVDVGGGSAGTDNINKVRASAFVTFSDESLKKDIEQMNGALDTVMSLKGVEFTWKNSDARDFGFIAQDVQEVLPQAVHENAGVHGVDYSRLTSVLVEAVKAQQVQINDLKKALKK